MNLSILKKLVELESVSGNEKTIVKELGRIATKLDIPNFFQDQNIVFYIKGKNRKRALIFNGHVDTVSAGVLDSWKHKPYGHPITITKDKIYGLGASDMKAGIFAFIETAHWFSKQKPPLDLWFSFVVKEEIDGSGTKSFINWFKKNGFKRYKDLACIISEPTGLKEIDIGHKGNYFVKITTFGNSGHAAYPERIKKHAVLEMFEIIKKLQKLEILWAKKYYHPVLRNPTIGIATSIEAGQIKSPNKYPDTCVASFDIRTTPKLHNKTLGELKKSLKDFSCKIELISEPCSFSYTEPKEKIVTLFKSILKDLPLKTTNGASDQCFFTDIGIPTLIFGPGDKEVILKSDEYCYLSKIKRSIEIYKEVVESF